ncbi:MAG: DUF6206 family protein [Flavobacteriaceae bacterium]|nr:DUF6206 family protein [Flavobacteriaceae bacterium]
MFIDILHIQKFEKGLNPQYPEKSEIPATIVGYGEISSIFKINPYNDWVFKRLPLFVNDDDATQYIKKYNDYVHYLKEAGISLPNDNTFIVKSKKAVVYVAQEALNKADLCQNLLHTLSVKETLMMVDNIFKEIKKVSDYNREHKEVLLSIDGQISNWALVADKLVYFDTSTPLFKIKGVEQMDPELLLNSTPRAMRWLIRKFFLQEVMDRYYDIRLIYIDLIANLYKEKKHDLIDNSIVLANNFLPKNATHITRREIDKYYQNDKFIWQLFLALRRLDRWLTNRVFGKQYEFILPGKIDR